MSEWQLVTIKQVGMMWFVLYVDRARNQHHSAAQFYRPDTTLEEVKEWVRNHPKFVLQEEGNA